MRRLFSVAALLVVFGLGSAGAEEPKKPNSEPRREIVATSGLYLGRVVEVDGKRRYVYVKPLKGDGPRKTFYLDKLTILRKARKSADWKELVPGKKIGIRFVREDDIAYAEGLFLIGAEINPREFEMPRKKVKKPEGEEKKKEEGEKKPPEKPKAFSPAAEKKNAAAEKKSAAAAGGGHH